MANSPTSKCPLKHTFPGVISSQMTHRNLKFKKCQLYFLVLSVCMCVFCYYSPTIPAPFCIFSLAIHGVTIHPARLDIFLFTSLAQALAVAFCRLSWGLTFLPSSPPVASTILNVNLMMLPLVYKPLTAARARRMRSLSFPWHCSSWHCLPPGLLLHFPLCALLTWPD